MAQVAQEDILQLLALLGALHLSEYLLLAASLDHDDRHQRKHHQGCDDSPHPSWDLQPPKVCLNISIYLIDGAVGLHPVKHDVDGVNELLVVTHVTIFPRHQGKVRSGQVVQPLFLNKVAGLIAEADQGIELSIRKIMERFRQVLDKKGLGTQFLERVLYGA